MTDTATCVVDCKNTLGEGALWDHRGQVLWWVDVPPPRPSLNRYDPATGKHDRWPMPEMVMSLAVREAGGLLVASHHGLNTFDPKDGALRRVMEPEAHLPRNRSNDGAADRHGRFWLGTMQNNIAPDGSAAAMDANSGALWRIDPDWSATRVLEDIGISNTLVWSPDDRIFYFADTGTGWIYAHDFDGAAGSVANRREFARDDRGWPDGSTIDAEGYIWNARWGGGCVLRFAPDGSVDRALPLPCDLVTSCAFGGPDLDTLYVTTARFALDEAGLAKQPQAGGLFAVEPGVKGLPSGRFAG
jgi:L-arabinonolactonase